MRNKRYTVAVRRLTDGDPICSVLAEFLGIPDGFDVDVKAVYPDRGSYDGKCLTLLQAHNVANVMPVKKWGTRITNELHIGWSGEIEHNLTTGFNGNEWTVAFPIMIDAMYTSTEDGREVTRHGYVGETSFIDTPRQARYHYGKRFGIEASYRLSEAGLISTTTKAPAPRLLFVVLSLLLQNVWRYLHGVRGRAPPRRPMPLVVASHGIHRHGNESCVEGTCCPADWSHEPSA